MNRVNRWETEVYLTRRDGEQPMALFPHPATLLSGDIVQNLT
jgi:hypothetical protein